MDFYYVLYRYEQTKMFLTQMGRLIKAFWNVDLHIDKHGQLHGPDFMAHGRGR